VTFVFVTSLKPDAFILTEYVPESTASKRYKPSEFVVVERVTFVSKFVSVTAAPETTAPFGSVTVPLTVPRLVCAGAADAASKIESKSVVSLNFIRKASLFGNTRARVWGMSRGGRRVRVSGRGGLKRRWNRQRTFPRGVFVTSGTRRVTSRRTRPGL
jgi:hypothetical protein